MTNLLFEDVLREYLNKLKNKRVLVAFSGGKDSLALLDFLNMNKSSMDLDLYACHVNHGLRDEAGEDEEFCKNFCQKSGIPFFVEHIGDNLSNNNSAGIEDWARRNRYAALKERAITLSCHYILTAHTFDDQIESFFTDLYTGASLFTLGGIGENHDFIMRIMLNITTAQIEDYLHRRSITPVYDKSNSDIRFIRNRMRHNVLPVLYSAGNDFVPTVLRLQKESQKLAEYFTERTKNAVISNTPNMVEIDRKIFDSFAEIEKEYLLSVLFATRFRFSKNMVTESLKLFTRKGSKRVNLARGYIIEVAGLKVRIFKKENLCTFLVEKESGIDTINVSDFRIEFKGRLTDKKLIIRSRLPGDRLPSGKKIKDIFIDNKIDLYDRDRAVVILEDNNIIWVEHLIKDSLIDFERIV